MTDEEIKARVLRVLAEIAPEVDPGKIEPGVAFREQIDLDSMDYLNFVIALDEEFQANIPETDYTKFVSLNECLKELKKLDAKNNYSPQEL